MLGALKQPKHRRQALRLELRAGGKGVRVMAIRFPRVGADLNRAIAAAVREPLFMVIIDDGRGGQRVSRAHLVRNTAESIIDDYNRLSGDLPNRAFLRRER